MTRVLNPDTIRAVSEETRECHECGAHVPDRDPGEDRKAMLDDIGLTYCGLRAAAAGFAFLVASHLLGADLAIVYFGAVAFGLVWFGVDALLDRVSQ